MQNSRHGHSHIIKSNKVGSGQDTESMKAFRIPSITLENQRIRTVRKTFILASGMA